MEILEIKDFLARNFNEILDVRSPCEFAQSHFVGRNIIESETYKAADVALCEKEALGVALYEEEALRRNLVVSARREPLISCSAESTGAAMAFAKYSANQSGNYTFKEKVKSQIVRNFAVLSDKEREEVGIIYRQDPFSARLLGAAAICKNISEFMPLLAEFITPARSFGLYCMRGGMRSRSLGVVLENIGYRPVLLKGGYKSYRAFVSAALRSSSFLAPLKFLTLSGASGCGKSEIIRAFSGGFSLDSIESSKQDSIEISSLDIENLADHLGSSFGGIFGAQKSQKAFENALFARFCELGANLDFQNLNIKNSDSIKIILCENESKKLGNIVLPSELFKAYQNAPKIEITAPLQERIERTCKLYGKIDESFFNTAMQKIAPFMQKAAHHEARAAFARRDLEKCAEILLLNYYDKVYRRSQNVRILEYKKANLAAVCEEILEITKEIYNI